MTIRSKLLTGFISLIVIFGTSQLINLRLSNEVKKKGEDQQIALKKQIEGLKGLSFLGGFFDTLFVQGNVTLQDSELVAGPRASAPTNPVRPLSGASVIFVPAEGRTSTATTDASGNYELWYTRERKGALPGAHTVEVRTPTIETDETGNERRLPQQVPARYNARSELKITVEEGKADYPLALTTSPADQPAETEEPSDDL